MSVLQKFWVMIDRDLRCLQAVDVPRVGEYVFFDNRKHIVTEIVWKAHERSALVPAAAGCLNPDFVLEPQLMTKALAPKPDVPEMHFETT